MVCKFLSSKLKLKSERKLNNACSCFAFQANATRTSLTLLGWRRRLNHKQQMPRTSIKVIYSCHHIMEQNSVPSCLRITAWHHRRVSSVVSTIANTDSVRLFAFTVFPSANTLTCRQSINFSFPPTPPSHSTAQSLAPTFIARRIGENQ